MQVEFPAPVNKTSTQDSIFDTEEVLGVPLAIVDLSEALQIVEGFIQGSEPQLVVTANAIAVVLAHDDPEFASQIRLAGLVTSDGAGTQWALGKKGHPNVPKVTGVDILENFCRLSADHGYRLFFLGGAPGVAQKAAERLRLRFPGCNVVGVRDGYFPASDDDVVAKEIGLLQPDIVFIAMGMPRQERFFLKNKHLLNAKVGIGVGGSFDVFSGRVKRAPGLWQRMHMEWLWRALQNPSKIKNLKNLPRFVWLVMTKR